MRSQFTWPPALPPSCMQTKRSGFKKLARGPTGQEIADETVVWVQDAKDKARKNGHRMFVSWDNPSNHPSAATAPFVGVPAESYVQLPSRSSDLHQIVEHANNRFKQGLARACTLNCWENLEFRQILQMVEGVADTITAESIQADLANLIDCYRIVSTDEGQPVQGLDHVVGTGGGYTAHIWA
jgi:hypothetical protein